MAVATAFSNVLAVTKSDTVPQVAAAGVAQPVFLRCGTLGTAIVITQGGQTVTVSMVAGEVLPVRITHVKTGGTATDLHVLY